jgi:hypothetical protein
MRLNRHGPAGHIGEVCDVTIAQANRSSDGQPYVTLEFNGKTQPMIALVFSPEQARDLAAELVRMAAVSEAAQKGWRM